MRIDLPTDQRDDLLLNPGLTCPNATGHRHRGRWQPGEVLQMHPNVIRTNVRFLCLLCGLTMDCVVDTFLPDGPGQETEVAYRIVGEYGYARPE
jgi:hypothetical protein